MKGKFISELRPFVTLISGFTGPIRCLTPKPNTPWN